VGEAAIGKKEHGSLALVQGHIEVGNSRVSPGQIYRLVQSFSQRKRELVEAIGFGGMLNVPNLTKLNLKLSLWLLNQVDIESQAIVVGDNHMIRFFDADVHKVFGIPCGPREIDGRDARSSGVYRKKPTEKCSEYQVADIGKFLNPGGLFEYLKIKYPNIVSKMQV